MPDGWTDPAGLDGDALTRWYLRSPADIERERQAAADRRYQDFFYGSDEADPSSGSYSAPEPGAGSDSAAEPPPVDSDAAWPDDGSGSAPPTQAETLPVHSATTPDLTLQPAAPPFDGPFLPPLTFNPIPATARWPAAAAPGPTSPGLRGGAQAYPSAYGAGRPAMAVPAPAAGQTISYGALRARAYGWRAGRPSKEAGGLWRRHTEDRSAERVVRCTGASGVGAAVLAGGSGAMGSWRGCP